MVSPIKALITTAFPLQVASWGQKNEFNVFEVTGWTGWTGWDKIVIKLTRMSPSVSECTILSGTSKHLST
jgi:hypothetical protein